MLSRFERKIIDEVSRSEKLDLVVCSLFKVVRENSYQESLFLKLLSRLVFPILEVHFLLQYWHTHFVGFFIFFVS